MFVARSVQGSGVRGGVGQLTRRWPTRDGQVLRATTPEGVSPIIGLVTLPLQTPGLILASRSYPSVVVVVVAVVVVVVVVVVLTACINDVFVDIIKRVHLIMGAVSLWTRPPALHLCAGP